MSRLSAKNFVFGLFFGATVAFGVKADVSANFKDHCAACHGADRLGGLGPALVPENLARLRKAEAAQAVGAVASGAMVLEIGRDIGFNAKCYGRPEKKAKNEIFRRQATHAISSSVR